MEPSAVLSTMMRRSSMLVLKTKTTGSDGWTTRLDGKPGTAVVLPGELRRRPPSATMPEPSLAPASSFAASVGTGLQTTSGTTQTSSVPLPSASPLPPVVSVAAEPSPLPSEASPLPSAISVIAALSLSSPQAIREPERRRQRRGRCLMANPVWEVGVRSAPDVLGWGLPALSDAQVSTP